MTSLIETMRADFPTAIVDVMVKRQNAAVLENNPYIRNVFSFDKSKGKIKALIEAVRFARLSNYTWVINCHRFFSSGLISCLAKGKVSGFAKNPLSFIFARKIAHKYAEGIHETDRNFELIRHLVKAQKPLPPKLYPNQKDFESVMFANQSPYWVIAPASVWFTKKYPINGWLSLIERRGDMAVYIIGGPIDIELGEEIAAHFPNSNVFNLSGKLSLLQSVALIKGSAHCFANDSAPTHMALAVDAPITTVFCSTTPDFGFWPNSEKGHIAQTQVDLKCRPCGIHGKKKCPEGHFNCSEFEIELPIK